jgi:hypothetical protein
MQRVKAETVVGRFAAGGGAELVQSSHFWSCGSSLIAALIVTALAGCGQSRVASVPPQSNDPRMTGDAHWRQVDLDVAAIVAGMAFAHGARAVAVRLPQ